MRSPVNKQDFMKLQVENLKALLEIESQVPLQQQQLLYNGKEMGNAETLSRLGVIDGDLVMMVSTPFSSSSRLHISSKQGQQDYWTEGQAHPQWFAFVMLFLSERKPVLQLLDLTCSVSFYNMLQNLNFGIDGFNLRIDGVFTAFAISRVLYGARYGVFIGADERLTVLSIRNCWSLGFPKRNHSPNKTVAGASRGYHTKYTLKLLDFLSSFPESNTDPVLQIVGARLLPFTPIPVRSESRPETINSLLAVLTSIYPEGFSYSPSI
ncbi:hypothetical protein LXL04_015701 [Taraxacum kok-saghyz]